MRNTGFHVMRNGVPQSLHCEYRNQPNRVGWFVCFGDGKDTGICCYNDSGEVDTAIINVFGSIKAYGLGYNPFFDLRDNPRFLRVKNHGAKEGFTEVVQEGVGRDAPRGSSPRRG
jgi:hypothetical protein